MPRAPGKIFADGPRELADTLVAALRAPVLGHEVAETLTHGFHSYPARLHPATARVLAELLAERSPRNAVLVDPFCGSGTTLVEARAAGLRAVGTDLNPLAVLVARAKTWTPSVLARTTALHAPARRPASFETIAPRRRINAAPSRALGRRAATGPRPNTPIDPSIRA